MLIGTSIFQSKFFFKLIKEKTWMFGEKNATSIYWQNSLKFENCTRSFAAFDRSKRLPLCNLKFFCVAFLMTSPNCGRYSTNFS